MWRHVTAPFPVRFSPRDMQHFKTKTVWYLPSVAPYEVFLVTTPFTCDKKTSQNASDMLYQMVVISKCSMSLGLSLSGIMGGMDTFLVQYVSWRGVSWGRHVSYINFEIWQHSLLVSSIKNSLYITRYIYLCWKFIRLICSRWNCVEHIVKLHFKMRLYGTYFCQLVIKT